MMADSTGKITLQEAIKSNAFQNSDRKIDYYIKNYWIRFSLVNNMQKEARISLPEVAARIDLFSKYDSSGWQHSQTGTDVSWSMRDGLKQIPAFTLDIPAGKSVTIYQRVKWNFVAAQPDTMAVYAAFTNKIIRQDYVSDDAFLMTGIQNTFLMGMVIISIVINLYFFLIVREKEFLWFCLFGFLFCLVSLSSLNDVFLREYPRFQLYLYIFSRSLIGFTAIHFVRSFLKTYQRFRKWDKWLVFFSYVQVVGLVISFFACALVKKNVSAASHFGDNFFNLIYGVSLLLTLFLYLRNHDRLKRLLVYAFLPTMFLHVLTYGSAIAMGLYYPRFGVPDVSGYTSAFNKAAFVILILCYLWMMILFTWVLFLRFSMLRKELEQQRNLDTMKARFFANISHEFRTPLTLIMGPLEDLMRDKDVEKFKQILPEMYRNSKRLLQLINQLLDLSKLGAGNYLLNTNRDDVIPFVRQIVHSFSSMAHRKNIQLETEVDPRLRNDLRNEQVNFYFDEDVLEKILFNLLSNAFKFTPDGGNIIVSLGLSEKEKGFIELKVEDNGIGIPPEKLPFIFDRFYQADQQGNGRFEGSGIGLSLVKELVELHGGSIRVTSQLKQQTVFICSLPLNKKIGSPEGSVQKKYDLSAPVSEEEEDKVSLKTNNSEPIVLLVEDQKDVRKYIREKLVDHYNVLEAKDGNEALAMAKAEMPDLIISDVMMPKKDGFELCRSLKTDYVTSHIPVILLTARAEDADKLAGLETGADAYLIKPFNSQELIIRVRNLVEVRAKMRAKFSDKLAVKPSEIAVTSVDRNFMQQLLTVTEKHIADENFSVEQLGQEVYMSTSQINRKLKALINQSAQQFIRSTRMQRAEELLKQNAGTIAEIAYEVGFRDPGYFSRVFKTHFGYPPSEIKNG